MLPRLLADFRQRHPAVAVALHPANSAQVAQARLRGELNLGFVEGPERLPGLHYQRRLSPAAGGAGHAGVSRVPGAGGRLSGRLLGAVSLPGLYLARQLMAAWRTAGTLFLAAQEFMRKYGVLLQGVL